MSRSFITTRVNEQAAGDWKGIQAEAATHNRSKVTVESCSEEKEWSDQQRKWWKGVLLPALAKHTGDSILVWETRLKFAILPEKFAPVTINIEGESYTYIPSVTILGMKKMNYLITESVAYLRDERRFGDEFHWVTLPDSELRS